MNIEIIPRYNRGSNLWKNIEGIRGGALYASETAES